MINKIIFLVQIKSLTYIVYSIFKNIKFKRIRKKFSRLGTKKPLYKSRFSITLDILPITLVVIIFELTTTELVTRIWSFEMADKLLSFRIFGILVVILWKIISCRTSIAKLKLVL